MFLLWVSRGPRWATVGCQQGIVPLGRSSGRCVSLPHQLRAATCMPGPVTPSLRLQNQQHYPSDSSVITSLGRQLGKILFVGSTRWSWILSPRKAHSNWILEVPLIVITDSFQCTRAHLMPLQLASISSLWPSPSSCHPYGLFLQLWFSFLLRALAITFASPGHSRIISSPQMCDLTPSAESLLLYRLTNSLAWGLEHEHCGRSFCLLQSTPIPKIHIPPWKVLKSFDPLQHQLKSAKFYLDLMNSDVPNCI